MGDDEWGGGKASSEKSNCWIEVESKENMQFLTSSQFYTVNADLH